MEASLDHIDDELFANLVSRVSYLKMRREWERESGARRPSGAHATLGGKGGAFKIPSAQVKGETPGIVLSPLVSRVLQLLLISLH